MLEIERKAAYNERHKCNSVFQTLQQVYKSFPLGPAPI